MKGSGLAPETVGLASGPVKYEMVLRRQPQTAPGLGTYLMTDENHIRIEWFAGQTADQVTGFTTAARIYVR